MGHRRWPGDEGQPSRAAVALAQLVVHSRPSSSTMYPQQVRSHQPACLPGMNPARIDPRMLAARTEPTMAAPRDWPSWRLEEFMPEAMPAWVFGTPDMTPLVIGELTMPAPTPNRP